VYDATEWSELGHYRLVWRVLGFLRFRFDTGQEHSGNARVRNYEHGGAACVERSVERILAILNFCGASFVFVHYRICGLLVKNNPAHDRSRCVFVSKMRETG
jgi:hypothetical protein